MSRGTRITKGRKHGQSLEQRVWFWLRRQPTPVRVSDLMAAMGLHQNAASHSLRRLGWKGCAVATGYGNGTRYVATRIRPDDLRGLAPGSQRVLQIAASNRRMTPKRARTRPIQRRHDGSALAQAWSRPAADQEART